MEASDWKKQITFDPPYLVTFYSNNQDSKGYYHSSVKITNLSSLNLIYKLKTTR